MFVVADARALPFRTGSFDAVVTSPPWDLPRVFHSSLAELARVCRRGGRMVVMQRSWTEVRDCRGRVVRRVGRLPQTGPGLRYPATPSAGAAALVRFGELVLDPFAGVGGVVRGAELGGAVGVGADVDEAAIRFGFELAAAV